MRVIVSGSENPSRTPPTATPSQQRGASPTSDFSHRLVNHDLVDALGDDPPLAVHDGRLGTDPHRRGIEPRRALLDRDDAVERAEAIADPHRAEPLELVAQVD